MCKQVLFVFSTASLFEQFENNGNKNIATKKILFNFDGWDEWTKKLHEITIEIKSIVQWMIVQLLVGFYSEKSKNNFYFRANHI